jgi:hypothetical protein
MERERLVAARPNPRVVFLHEENITAIYKLTTFPIWWKVRCPSKKPCSAEDLRAWRDAIAREVSPALHSWSNCSVVGSSGILLHREQGQMIDSANAVIRVNTGPVHGFEQHVGRRTTMRLWGFLPPPGGYNAENASHAASDRHATGPANGVDGQDGALIVYCQPVKWLSGCWTAITHRPVPRVSPLVWERVRAHMRLATGRKTEGKFPSTGAIAIWIARQLCRKVHVFGFGEGRGRACRKGGLPVCGKYTDPVWSARQRRFMCDWSQRIYHFMDRGAHDWTMEEAYLDGLAVAGDVEWHC